MRLSYFQETLVCGCREPAASALLEQPRQMPSATHVQPRGDPNRCQSLLLTLVSGGFLLSGSNTVNLARTLAVSPANSDATGRWRPGKTQLMAQARPGSFFALACGTRGLAAGRSIPCQAVKRRSSSTVKLGIAVLFSEPPGPWSARSANCSPCGWR